MGGPSERSWREARAREAARPPQRSRGGLVDLAEWRSAAHAAGVLLGVLHDPPWLRSVRAGLDRQGRVVLRVLLLVDGEMIRCCLPSSVDHVEVVVEVQGAPPRHGNPT